MPSNDLAAAGVLAHVLDGEGIDMQGFLGTPRGLPPAGNVLWNELGRPRDNDARSDRVAASIINKAAPHLYEPLNVMNLVSNGFSKLPFVLLREGDEVTSRLSCCHPEDASSIRVTCSPLGGGSACTPGCREWSHPPEELRECLARMEIGRCHWCDTWCGERPNGKFCGQAYNEVILDSFRGGRWQKPAMIAAVAIAIDASENALALAREVHAAARLDIPSIMLIFYDKFARRACSSELNIRSSWNAPRSCSEVVSEVVSRLLGGCLEEVSRRSRVQYLRPPPSRGAASRGRYR